jgi:negative regulator of sigma E activity
MMPYERERELDRLFARYRQEVDYRGEASPDFMPRLWERIEARRSGRLAIERFARLFATAAVALAVLCGVFVSFAPQRSTSDETWVETIANHQLAQHVSYYEPVRLSPVSDAAAAPSPGNSAR